jgi:IMP dehydrogenase/GMP reductase
MPAAAVFVKVSIAPSVSFITPLVVSLMYCAIRSSDIIPRFCR